MAHFAKIENNIVREVIVAEPEFIQSGVVGDPETWIQTSYNTRGGVYYKPNSNEPHEDQSKAFRKNYAGVGFSYDKQRDAFIPPKIFSSWLLNEDTCLWEPPIPEPIEGGPYTWNEEERMWISLSSYLE